MDSPLQRVTTNMPSAAKGSVSARNVSGASSPTPIFSTGQLHPHTSVNMRIGTTAALPARAIGCAPGRALCALIGSS